MQDLVTLKGMVLKSEPQGEYDRRVVILSRERGRITAFAKGARKIGNRFMAATNPFVFGEFKLYEGRTSYSINEVSVENYFEDMRLKFEESCYGMYFLEIADYYSIENADESEMLLLVYRSLQALLKETIGNRFIRAVFEIKAVSINGEFAGIGEGDASKYTEGAKYSVDYICRSSIKDLFNFSVSEEVLTELERISQRALEKTIDRKLKSAELLNEFID